LVIGAVVEDLHDRRIVTSALLLLARKKGSLEAWRHSAKGSRPCFTAILPG
jgi:hypothetical protein